MNVTPQVFIERNSSDVRYLTVDLLIHFKEVKNIKIRVYTMQKDDVFIIKAYDTLKANFEYEDKDKIIRYFIDHPFIEKVLRAL